MYKIKLKKILKLTILTIVILNLVGCTSQPKGIVAKVNHEKIEEEEYNMNLEIRETFYQGELSEASITEDILDELILEKIIIQEAERENLVISDSEIEEEIDNSIDKLGGEEEFLEELENKGITLAYYKKFLEKQGLFRKYRKLVIDKIDINEDRARDYYLENKDNLVNIRASHIVVESKEEGEEILNKLDQGREFSQLAVEKSLDKLSAVKGGDLGYFSKGDLNNKKVEEEAFQLEVGEISNLIESDNRYYILYLQDRRENFDDLKEDIVSMLKGREYKEHIQKLRDEAKVKIYLELDK